MSLDRLPRPGELIRVLRTRDGREVVGRLLASPKNGEAITQDGSEQTYARLEAEDGQRTWVLYSTDPATVTYALADAPPEAPPDPELPIAEEEPPKPEDGAQYDEIVKKRLQEARARMTPRAPDPDPILEDEEEAPEKYVLTHPLTIELVEQCYREIPCKRYEPEEEAPPPKAEPEETKANELRPQTLDEYDVGQGSLVRIMRMEVAGALFESTALPHVLLSGPPGLGKTTLAYVVANELGTTMHQTSGPALEDASSLVGLLADIREGDILFIDEIHRLPNTISEYLYQAMEDFRIDFIEGEKGEAKTVVRELPHFTVVGATTNSGDMPRPLRDRFGIQLHLVFYNEEQLAAIAGRTAGILGTSISPVTAQELARRSRGTARIVNRLVERARTCAIVLGGQEITDEVLHLTLDMMEIDEAGLTALDRRFLRTIEDQYGGGPVGLQAIAATIGEDKSIVAEVIEPYLLLRGYVNRTPRGREITERGRAHMAGRDS